MKLDNIQYEIDSSQYYFDHGDYHSASQLLAKVIEVSYWILPKNFSISHKFCLKIWEFLYAY